MIQESKLLADIDLSSIQKLTLLIKDRYNYDFTNYALSSFKRRVARILEAQKMNHTDELIKKLETDSTFFNDFLTYLTVNVTEMFRDPTFWKYMKEEILPNLHKEKKTLKIWHAGCSSGEEVYSMIITLKELGIINDVSITASDLDIEILDKAKKGRYPVKNLILNNQNFTKSSGEGDLSKYINTDDHYFYINSDLKQYVDFKEHNLVSGGSLGDFDIILCRNVLIYFNQTLQNEVLKTLHNTLLINGILAIGSKESLIWCDNFNKFKTINLEEKVFKKILD
jgi:chemotaxis protein methyltransferase CheR